MEIVPPDNKILVVDDVISNVLLLKVLLKNEKYDIITANNGIEALSQVKEKMPDLILLDVMMPDLNGFEVCERLKQDKTTAEIPIIFLTALNNTSDIVKGFKVGANDFISKPFNKEELLIRVRHQMSLITAKRTIFRQNKELQRTISARDKLYSVIGHDLRSPIGTIKMVLNMLLINIPSEQIGEELYNLLSTANQTTEEVFSLLDNLLKWTKSQTGRLNVVYQDINIIETIQGVIQVYVASAGLKNIKIVHEMPEEVMVHCDIDMVKTVIRNFMSNALKFSPNDTTITVRIEEKEEGFVQFSIQDQGCGIDDEGKKKLLHENTHYSTFGLNNEEGSGLGLLLCKDFIIKNGGKLWFETEKGNGSTFFFSLPLAN
ncbi:MAG: hybrid sensor histidine kinase/response regulator [Bacteroidaceae bacterium]